MSRSLIENSRLSILIDRLKKSFESQLMIFKKRKKKRRVVESFRLYRINEKRSTNVGDELENSKFHQTSGRRY